MKYSLLISALVLSCGLAHAIPAQVGSDNLSKGMQVIAKRFASKNLTEVVVIAMKLQMECQKFNSKEVCEGVKNIMTVLEARVKSLPKTYKEDSSVAFVKGLMDGVNDANQQSIVKIKQIP